MEKMKKMTCLVVAAVAPVLIVSAQAQTSRSAGTSIGSGLTSLKASQKTAPEPKHAEPQKEDRAEAVTTVTFSGPTSGWGFTKSPTPYYTVDGKNLGTLPGGTLLDYSSVKTTSKNMVLVAKVKQGGDWTGPFLLDCSSLAIFEGKPDTVDPEIVSDLTQFFTLKAKVAERKAEIEKTEYEKNAHFQSAKRAQERYAKSISDAKELSDKAEKQTGAARTKSLTQLREMKSEQTRIKAEADKEAANYKAWKLANTIPPARFQADPEIVALEKQLAPLKTKLGALATSE